MARRKNKMKLVLKKKSAPASPIVTKKEKESRKLSPKEVAMVWFIHILQGAKSAVEDGTMPGEQWEVGFRAKRKVGPKAIVKAKQMAIAFCDKATAKFDALLSKRGINS
jgi:hypothetical protein